MILSSSLSLARTRTQIMRFAVFLQCFTNSYNKNKKWQSSGQVEIDSTCPDDCQILIGSPSAAGDRQTKWRASGRAIIELLKKEPLFVRGLSVFLSFGVLQKSRPPTRMCSGPDPLTNTQRTVAKVNNLCTEQKPSFVCLRIRVSGQRNHSLKPQKCIFVCTGGRARPRIMDCAKLCTAQPVTPLYWKKSSSSPRAASVMGGGLSLSHIRLIDLKGKEFVLAGRC
jgi:hypothetical protein